MQVKSREARIENTAKCNARCKPCPREAMTRPKLTMRTDHFEYLVRQCVDLGVKLIQIGGYGEPLMDFDLVKKVRIVADAGIESFVTTNGALLSQKLAAELIEAGLDNIRFSVHGIEKRTYEDSHGLSYAQMWKNFEGFMRQNIIRDHRTTVHMMCLALHGEDPLAFARKYEPYVDYLEVWQPHNWAYGREYREISRKKKRCERPFRGPLQINADGKMMVCCMDFDAKLTVGNTFEESIEEILKGEAFNSIREMHTSGEFGNSICARCDQRNVQPVSPLLYQSQKGAVNREALCQSQQ